MEKKNIIVQKMEETINNQKAYEVDYIEIAEIANEASYGNIRDIYEVLERCGFYVSEDSETILKEKIEEDEILSELSDGEKKDIINKYSKLMQEKLMSDIKEAYRNNLEQQAENISYALEEIE